MKIQKNGIFFLAIFFGVLGMAKISWASTYYAAAWGDDSNPGTMTEPWQHCPGMPGWTGSATLVPGDSVCFNNQCTWEAASGNALLEVTGGVAYDGRTWGNGARALLRLTGTLPRSVIDIMVDHPTEPTVIAGFEVDANHQITSGITINWPNATGNLTGALKRIEDCVVHGVYSQSSQGQYEYGIAISSGYGGNRWVSNVEVLNCVVHDISRGGINVYSANDDPNSGISNVLVRQCEVYNTGTDPDYAGCCLPLKNHVIDVIVEYNYIHHPVRGIGMSFSTEPGFTGCENAIVRHNIIKEVPSHCGMYISGGGNKSFAIYGNIIMNNAYEGIRLAAGLEDTLSGKIYNNTFYHNMRMQWSQELRIETNNAIIPILEVKNNIFCAASMTRCIVDDDADITAHNDNIYYRPGNDVLVISNGVSYYAGNITTWEPTAMATYPQFKDTTDLPAGFAGTYGIDLQPIPDGLNITENSPAKDSGAALGGLYNTSINSITRPSGGGWDIGAYEFNESEVFEEHLLQVFPNPCRVRVNKNDVTFNWLIPESTIKIYSILGRLVHSSGIITQPTYTWNVTSISSGLYFFVVKSARQPDKTTGKIVVMR